MSKYLTFTETSFKNLETLLAAIRQCGYTQIEQGVKIKLNGWGNQKKTADIVLRKNVVGATFGDVGFRKTDTGYEILVDDLDINRIHSGKFLPSLKTAYHEQAAQKLATSIHGTVTRRVEGGKIKILIRR